MKKRKVVSKVLALKKIELSQEECLRFFGLIVKGRLGSIEPPAVGESINFYSSMSTRRNMKKDGTVWKLFMGVNVVVLDSEIDENVEGDKFITHLMELVANKVISSVNREKRK